MARKSKKLRNEKQAAAQKLQELQRLEEEAQKEEQAIIENAKKEIDAICEKAGLFCGIILPPKELGAVVELAATTNENIKIGFHLYFNE